MNNGSRGGACCFRTRLDTGRFAGVVPLNPGRARRASPTSCGQRSPAPSAARTGEFQRENSVLLAVARPCAAVPFFEFLQSPVWTGQGRGGANHSL
jgi:hypothetical protein